MRPCVLNGRSESGVVGCHCVSGLSDGPQVLGVIRKSNGRVEGVKESLSPFGLSHGHHLPSRNR